jgi:hypothetical protein
MNYYSGRFIQNQQVTIFIYNIQGHFFGNYSVGHSGQVKPDQDLIAAFQHVTGFDTFIVDQNQLACNEILEM